MGAATAENGVEHEQDQDREINRRFYGSSRGIIFALLVLIGNGIHPIINYSKPAGFDSLIFAWMMSFWELIGALLIHLMESRRTAKAGVQAPPSRRNRGTKEYALFLIIGLLFAIATYFYIEGLTLAGSIAGSIALKAAPIYSLILGVLFLGETINWKQIVLTAFMLLGLFYMATRGTFNFGEFNVGVAILLVVPLLWTVGHAITKPLLEKGVTTTPEIIVIRLGIVFAVLFVVSLGVNGWGQISAILASSSHMFFAFLMGIVYLVVHYAWYRSITSIDLSLSSALVIPSPAITTVFALLITKEPLHVFHVIGMAAMFIGLYAMVAIKMRKKALPK